MPFVIGAGTWHCFPKKKNKLQSNNIRHVRNMEKEAFEKNILYFLYPMLLKE
jgi:hypothetical protein